MEPQGRHTYLTECWVNGRIFCGPDIKAGSFEEAEALVPQGMWVIGRLERVIPLDLDYEPPEAEVN